MSLFGLARHIAVFYDDKGEFVGRKTISMTGTSVLGQKKKTFDFGKGTYNINPLISRAKTRGLTIIFDDYVYNYNVNNPDPISMCMPDIKPIMDPEVYKYRLRSKLVTELHKAAESGLSGLLTWKNVIIFLVVAAIAYYLFSGGQIIPTGAETSTTP